MKKAIILTIAIAIIFFACNDASVTEKKKADTITIYKTDTIYIKKK